ncbi:MAG: anhydro-N-acetylmuramic acid kinase, partial [Chromatocurvus sp.]
ADFRRRDIAAGGEGAPLVPAFHLDRFAHHAVRRAIVNIGGIANATLLDGRVLYGGFDCGPGNTLLDHWIHATRGAPYDAAGAWSAEGDVVDALLSACLDDPFFTRTGPRSTGREYFSGQWLQSKLAALPGLHARDVQATLAELTACAIVRSLASASFVAEEVYVCGGGAHNDDIMRRLYRLLQPARLETTLALGLHPDWVEAAAFAWLARRRLDNLPGNAPEVTGARGGRILGAVYPGRAA